MICNTQYNGHMHRPTNIIPLLWGSEGAHAVLLYISVSTHFTLHFPSAAFHIPPHRGAEGADRSRGRHEERNKLCVCFSSYLSL